MEIVPFAPRHFANVDCGDILTILSTQICTTCVTSPSLYESVADSLASASLL